MRSSAGQPGEPGGTGEGSEGPGEPASNPPGPPQVTSASGALGMYRRHARFYDLTRWLFLRGRRGAVARTGLAEGGRALEVGCGTGANLLRLRGLVGPGGRVHGLDLSPEMLAVARRKVERRGWENVRLHEGDAGHFELGSRFDAVLYSYSLSMIPNWRSSLAAAARHLRPGGRLVVVDFGRMRRLGPLGRLARKWLRYHHVDAERPYVAGLEELFGAARVERGWLGWHFIATATATALKPEA